MNGPIIVGFIVLMIFLLVKYSEHVKKVFAVAGQPPSVGTEASATTTSREANSQDWLTKKQWTVVLLVIGIGVVLWGIFHPVRLSDTVGWWEYWFSLLVFWGVLAALIALNKWPGTLQWILAGVMVAIFVIMTVAWIKGDKQSPEKATLTMVPSGKSQYIPVPQGKYVVMEGEDFRYHCVYGDGHEESFGKGETRCSDGHVPFVYATNNRAKEANVVTYSYAQR